MSASVIVGGRTGSVHTRFSECSNGDFAVNGEPAALERRRQSFVEAPWSWLNQVHGTGVVEVKEPGGGCGRAGDALVTTVRGAVLAVQTADCAPVMLWADSASGPVVAAVHAGWRGLYDGIITSAAASMRERGGQRIRWRLGPCISPEAYEFGSSDLTTLALRFGPEVVGVTAEGTAAFDLARAVWSELRSVGIDVSGAVRPPCTAGSTDSLGRPRWFSYRARADRQRQTSVIWIEQ